MAAQGSAASKAHGMVGELRLRVNSPPTQLSACPEGPLFGVGLFRYNAWLHLPTPTVSFLTLQARRKVGR